MKISLSLVQQEALFCPEWSRMPLIGQFSYVFIQFFHLSLYRTYSNQNRLNFAQQLL